MLIIERPTTDLDPFSIEKLPPLSLFVAEVLVAVQRKNLLQWAQPLQTHPKDRDPYKYCQFHRVHGHDINNCYQLKNEIEKLIKRGYLKNFIKNEAGPGNRPEERKEPTRERAA